MSNSKKPTMPNVKGMSDMPTDAELEALQAEIENAKQGLGSRAAAAKAEAESHMSEDDIKAQLEKAGLDGNSPDAGAAAVARIQELETELANLKDQSLRAMADAENVKKRAEREVAAAKMFGIEKFAQDILSVHDNLSRALLTLNLTRTCTKPSRIFRLKRIRVMLPMSCKQVLKSATAPCAPRWSPSVQVP